MKWQCVADNSPPRPGRLAWSNDPQSYAGGSVATGRASHAGQVKGDDPKKDTLALQVGDWAWG